MTTQVTHALSRNTSLPAARPSSSPSGSSNADASPSAARPATWLARTSRRLLGTTRDPASTLARVSLALLLFPHGAQHALGWFGGYGFSGTHGWMTKTLGFPAPLAALAITTEILAPPALLLGLAGRAAALGVISIMLGAILTHASNGFFMNWFGTIPAGQEGFEYHLMTIALAAVVVLRGSGSLSADGWLTRTTSTSASP
jgi:putative oxidoreductase